MGNSKKEFVTNADCTKRVIDFLEQSKLEDTCSLLDSSTDSQDDCANDQTCDDFQEFPSESRIKLPCERAQSAALCETLQDNKKRMKSIARMRRRQEKARLKFPSHFPVAGGTHPAREIAGPLAFIRKHRCKPPSSNLPAPVPREKSG